MFQCNRLRKKFLATFLLILLALAITSILIALALYPEDMGRGRGDGMGLMGNFLLISVIPIGAIIGALALVLYYIILPEMPYVKTKEESKSIEEKSDQKTSAVKSLDSMMSFFDADEKRVIEVLKEAGGSMLQKEITWKTGYSKVKTHRIVHRLAKRGILEVEEYFNTNKVKIKDDLLGEPNNIGD